MRLVLIDDSETDLLYARIVLERSGLGCEIVSFESAREALAYLQASLDDGVRLILLDINMPGMDGFEFLDAWERTAAARTAVVIMLSSSAHPADTERARRYERVRGYITKPIDREQAAGLARYFAP